MLQCDELREQYDSPLREEAKIYGRRAYACCMSCSRYAYCCCVFVTTLCPKTIWKIRVMIRLWWINLRLFLRPQNYSKFRPKPFRKKWPQRDKTGWKTMNSGKPDRKTVQKIWPKGSLKKIPYSRRKAKMSEKAGGKNWKQNCEKTETAIETDRILAPKLTTRVPSSVYNLLVVVMSKWIFQNIFVVIYPNSCDSRAPLSLPRPRGGSTPFPHNSPSLIHTWYQAIFYTHF